MDYYLNGSLAMKFGIKEALVLDLIHEDISSQKANNSPEVFGCQWCRLSHKILSARLPMISRDSARRILERLVKLNILKKNEINRSRFDRTASYAFTEYGKAVFLAVFKDA